jgi:predicted deacetylase
MPVHVSIHDVSPAWTREVEAAIDLCHAEGVKPALLVVPDFHGRAPLLADERFCARLRDLQAAGHEIYLHGFFHASAPAYDGAHGASVTGVAQRLAWLFAQRVVSGGEAEMSDVTEGEGRRRIEQGEDVLARAGLRIDGFVAPAWSMPRWLLPLLAERAYGYTEDHLRVYDPAGKRARLSVVLNWASRSPARLLSTVAWCRAARPARALMPARLAIHPADMRFLVLRREVESALAWARGHVAPRGVDLLC